MTDTLAKLFGTASKVKIMRLFLFNPETPFDISDIRRTTRIHTSTARKVINTLYKAGMIKKKTFSKTVPVKKRGRPKKGAQKKTKKKKVKGWMLNKKFPYLQSLHKLLIGTDPFSHKEILQKLKGGGRLKLVIVSGVFMQEWDTRVDLLIVGERLKKRNVRKAVRAMEAEIGKELTYALFNTKEFTYRLNVYDKLIRDILDYPHEVILDKAEYKKTFQSL